MMLRNISAFIRKDFLIQLSYRLYFFLNLINIFGSILIFYFIGKLFEKESSPYLMEYGGKYFPFVFIGVALSGCLVMTLETLSRNIRIEQMTGTLEAVLVTPVRLYTLIISMSIWNLIFVSATILIYLLCGVYFFGVKLISMNFLVAGVVFLLAIISFSSIGILSSSFIIVFKKGDPVNWLIGIFTTFFGGAYFPVDIFPKYLRNISQALPNTYALNALRKALLKGDTLRTILPDMLILACFCAVLLPLSFFLFRYAVKRAKIAGSLTHY